MRPGHFLAPTPWAPGPHQYGLRSSLPFVSFGAHERQTRPLVFVSPLNDSPAMRLRNSGKPRRHHASTLVSGKPVKRGTHNAVHKPPAEAGETRCSGSAAWVCYVSYATSYVVRSKSWRRILAKSSALGVRPVVLMDYRK